MIVIRLFKPKRKDCFIKRPKTIKSRDNIFYYLSFSTQPSTIKSLTQSKSLN